MDNKNIKIWCTLGPSSLNHKVITRLEEMGVAMFRINLSHTPLDQIEKNILEIKRCTSLSICLDTEGPQVRTANVENGKVFLKENSSILLKEEEVVGNEQQLSLRPRCIFSQLRVGDLVSIDFDSVLLSVLSIHPGGILAKVICEGSVGSNKAVSVDWRLEMPILTDKDQEAIKILKKYNLKDISLSFVNTSQDVQYVRQLVGKEVRIISKIETTQALKNLEEILACSDAILIDRGDLSREEPINKIPLLQKEIIKKANQFKKEVYVATNFLESMVKTKKPLRSEVNDIMTTLLDGADGLVLAAETAIGQYPAECANMVRRMVKYFKIAQEGRSLSELLNSDSFLLIEPHGGKLVNRFKEHVDEKSLESLPKLFVDEFVLLDAEQIAIGTYSPLEGFMTKEELFGVLDHYRLPEGTLWPLPILLQVRCEDYQKIPKGMEIALVLEKDQIIYATMFVEDKFTIPPGEVAYKWFGTNDKNHPGVKRFLSQTGYCLGGKITLIRRKPSLFKEYEYTPKQMRMIFDHKEWSKVAGFHTRNAIHRAHEYLQSVTLERYNLDGVLLHPIVGPKKTFDFHPTVILESYKIMLERHYPKNKFVFGVFAGYSHYAGPREAVFTALCRKNFGCSHFILGRDHTGVKNFYQPDEAKALFERLGDMGIKPIFYDAVYYCPQCGQYVENCTHDPKDFQHISGTQAREIFLSGGHPPEWFLREEIASMIKKKIRQGEEVFVR